MRWHFKKTLPDEILEVLVASPLPTPTSDIVAIVPKRGRYMRQQVWVVLSKMRSQGLIEQLPGPYRSKYRGVRWRLTSKGSSYATFKNIRGLSFA